MTSAVSISAWRRLSGRLWVCIALVFLLQFALLSWLSGSASAAPGKPAAAPVFRLSRLEPGTLVALEDPTLFALPRGQSHSGQTGLKIPAREFHLENQPESPRWLLLDEAQLVAAFTAFSRTSAPPAFRTALITVPVMAVPELPPLTPIVTPSSLHLEGDLNKRRLLSPPALPPQPGADLLTNTVVQLLVDAAGNTFSAALVHRSGSAAADQLGLQIARASRFEPIDVSGPDRPKAREPKATLGRMVFEWQSLPLTNAPDTSLP